MQNLLNLAEMNWFSACGWQVHMTVIQVRKAVGQVTGPLTLNLEGRETLTA